MGHTLVILWSSGCVAHVSCNALRNERQLHSSRL